MLSGNLLMYVNVLNVIALNMRWSFLRDVKNGQYYCKKVEDSMNLSCRGVGSYSMPDCLVWNR